MDYVSDTATTSTPIVHQDYEKAAKSALTNMINMLELNGFNEREMTLAIAEAVDDHILELSRQ